LNDVSVIVKSSSVHGTHNSAPVERCDAHDTNHKSEVAKTSGRSLFPLTVLILWLGLGFECVSSAHQAAIPEPPNKGQESLVEVTFAGSSWRVPKRFFRGISPFGDDSKELLIQLGWKKDTDKFSAVEASSTDMKLNVHIRTQNVEDPRMALDITHRFNQPFTKIASLSTVQMKAMTYIGSDSSIHYFRLNEVDAYVSCISTNLASPVPAGDPADVLAKKFRCNTVFLLPQGSYAWVTNLPGSLTDIGSSFTSTYYETLSFIR
jgi:hypothetical protein